LIVWVSRYVSLGSITAAAILPLAVWSLGAQERSDSVVAPALFVAAVGGALIIFMHRANIERLLHGKENKLK
jgi:glycerol-3-phosphate acyltransferase PlsY